MWLTMPGNTEDALSGSAIVPPRLTDSTTSAIAFSMTRLPAVFAVMSSAASSGTPALTSALSVRDQRASAIFWTMSPIFIGMRRRNASHWPRPRWLLFHVRESQAAPAVVPLRFAEDPDRAGRQQDPGPPVALDAVRERDRDLRDRRQVAAELLEDPDEHGNDEGHEADEDAQGEAHDDARIDHRRLDLPAQRVLLLELVGNPH